MAAGAVSGARLADRVRLPHQGHQERRQSGLFYGPLSVRHPNCVAGKCLFNEWGASEVRIWLGLLVVLFW